MITLKVPRWELGLGVPDHLRDKELNPDEPIYLVITFEIQIYTNKFSSFFTLILTNPAALQKMGMQQDHNMFLIYGRVVPSEIVKKCIEYLEGLVFLDLDEAYTFLNQNFGAEEFPSHETISLRDVLSEFNKEWLVRSRKGHLSDVPKRKD